MATHFHKLKVKDIRRETPDCVSVAFEIPDKLKTEFSFTQGQNITLKTQLDGEEIRRSYSICSSPLEDELRIAIKKIDAGRFSSHANDRLRPGDMIDVLPPTGKFYTELNAEQKRRYLAIAAGSGITPILSIIKTALAVEPQSSFTLIYGNRNRGSIIFREQLEALKNRFMNRFVVHHVLSREQTDSAINHGRIDAGKCDEFANGLINFKEQDQIFLCGPAEMIFSVRDWLEAHDIDRKKIHFELFGTPAEAGGSRTIQQQSESSYKGRMSSVSVRLDGISFQFPLPFEGRSILDESLAQGADLPYACKGGVCATCRAKLVEGEVEMNTNYALEADELALGFILTCQSHPRSDVVKVDFDLK